ncbi:ATP-binding protein [Streptomyces sp. 4.24]|uniref:ATP-binding protein n=1 Tax=Streptomyces tritrimontium TaxID=3406573 RepID=UPI003BB6D189
MRLVWEGRIVTIEVRDSGPGRPVVEQPDRGARSGRGLWLLAELADEFQIRDERVGKTVRARFKLAPA